MSEQEEVKVETNKNKSPLQIAIEQRGGQLSPAQRFATAITPNFVERALVGAYTGAPPPTLAPAGTSGAQGINRTIENLGRSAIGLPRDFFNVLGQTANYFGGRDPQQSANWGDYAFGASTAAPPTTPSYGPGEGFYPSAPTGAADTGATMAGGGSGVSGPDFSAYRNALMSQAGDLNARIQAMYNALGEEAGANVGRIQDIYGGAGEGIGNVYDSATGNVADAYGSAQQQAADQLARLGIEAAAPAVIDPMALSQAEAVSGLEQGRASGQAAAERYGASAGGFGSQMAQVAQQQGTEMNAAILGALQQRLADSLLMEEQGRMAAGSGGGSAQDALTAYQQAQLMAGAEDRGISAAQWQIQQEGQLRQDIVDTTFRLMELEGLPFTEAQAQATAIVTGQAPAAPQESGGFFSRLFGG